jgi:biopolymer transport protein TolR
MSMTTSGGSSVKAEPNVTPMIDVMLVLLIIFMLVVPAISAGFQAIPPQGTNLKPHPEEERDQVLGIDANGQYFLNKKPIPNAQLGQLLKEIYASREEDKLLYVKAHKDLEYAKVVDALDVASKNDVRVTAMITDQKPGTISAIQTDRIISGTAGGKK